MANNHFQKGDVLDWTNDSGAKVASGSMVALGSRTGVALVDIADGATGSVAVEEVFEVAKKSVAINLGQVLYLDDSEGKVTGTATDNVLAGYAFAAAASGDETVLLKLNG